LVYVSEMAKGVGSDDLCDIRQRSTAYNAQAGLTGFLFVDGRRFIGLLEGPRRRLLARMERIATDPRHTNLRVLREEEVAERRFRNWSFGPPLPMRGAASDTFIRTLVSRL
jgi:hypothetical protein